MSFWKSKRVPDSKEHSSPSLTIVYKNKQPVEVADFANSLFSVSEEYRRFSELNSSDEQPGEVRLYVKEMKEGSIVAVLEAIRDYGTPAVVVALPLMSDVNTFVRFGGYLKTAFDYLRDSTGAKPDLSKSSLENLNRIVEPVAKDPGSQININITGNNNNVMVVSASSIDSNAIQNAAKRAIKNLASPAQQSYEKVLLTWHQVRNDSENKGDRAIIESISEKPVKCIFDNDTVKTAMIADKENFFRLAFVVDVMVERIRGKIVLYKIMGLYEKLSVDSLLEQYALDVPEIPDASDKPPALPPPSDPKNI